MNPKTDHITEVVFEMIKDTYKGNHTIKRETDLKDLFDSLEKSWLCLHVENEFDIRINDSEIKELSNVQSLISLVEQKC